MKLLSKAAAVLVSLSLFLAGCTFGGAVNRRIPTLSATTPTSAATAIASTSTDVSTGLLTATVPEPSLTPEPTATAFPSSTPTPEPTATAFPSSTPTLEPTATAIPAPTPLVSWNDLSFYKRAMRSRFVGDVDWVEKTLHPTHYQLDVFLKWPSKIEGTEIVRYTNAESVPLDKVYFRLFPNIPGWESKTVVERVWLDGKPVRWRLESSKTALVVPLAPPLRPGDSVEIAIEFSVDIPSGEGSSYAVFGYKNGVLSLAHFYPMIPAFDSAGWHVEIPPPYGDLTYSDTSFYYVRLRTDDAKLKLAASGKIIRHAVEDGISTWIIASGPMRDVNFVLSPNFGTASAKVGDTTVTSYFVEADEGGGKRVLKYASDALSDYSARFGEYPFDELDVVETGTTAGGVEYPGLVVISNLYYQEVGGFLEFATAHEVAHQWWYSMVGNDQVNHPWLDEALTNYSAYVYEVDVHGDQAGKKIFEYFFTGPYEAAGEEKDLPIGLPVKDYDESTYGAIVYGKGPLFFDALRKEVGDEQFFRILRVYFTRYRYRTAAPVDFLRVATEVTGKNLKPLFDRWGAR